jgi:hypothetical protein
MAEVHLPHASHGGGQPEVSHEQSDVNINAILGFAGALVAVGIFISFFVWLLFGYFNAREARQAPAEFPLAAGQESRLPPEPRLQTNPREDLRELRAAEDDALTTYGWVDRNAGIVRIPIDDAMKLVVQRGLPARAPSPAPARPAARAR